MTCNRLFKTGYKLLTAAMLTASGLAHAGSAVLVCDDDNGSVGFNRAICDVYVTGGTIEATDWAVSGNIYIINSTIYSAGVGCYSGSSGGTVFAHVRFTDGSQDTASSTVGCDGSGGPLD